MSLLIGFTMTSGKPCTYTSNTRETEHVVVVYLSMLLHTYITTTKEKRHARENSVHGRASMKESEWSK